MNQAKLNAPHLRPVSIGRYFLLGITSLFLCSSILFTPFTMFPLALAILFYGRVKGIYLGVLGLGACYVMAQLELVQFSIIYLYLLSFIVSICISETFLRKIHPLKGYIVTGVISLMALGSIAFSIIMKADKFIEIPVDEPIVQSRFEISRNFKALIFHGVQSFNSILQTNKPALIEKKGAEAKAYIDLWSNVAFMVNEIYLSLPFYLFIGLFLTLWVNFYLVVRVITLNQSRYPFSMEDFFNFKVPEVVVWGVVTLLVLTLTGDKFFSGPVNQISFGLLLCLGLFYFFQGMGIYHDFLNYIKFRGIFRSVLVFFTVLSAWWILALVGLFDLWVNFRKYFNKNNKHKGEA